MSRRLLRIVALLTLFLFVGLRVTEEVHKSRPDHVEARCALCQLVLHAPIAGGRAPVVAPRQTFRRVSPAVFRPPVVCLVPSPRGRSPPAA